MDLKQYAIWFVTGSQHLYGPDTLAQVEAHSREMADVLDRHPAIPCRLVFRPVLTTPDAIARLCEEANQDGTCAGIVTWMHTFSPSKMWIAGLTRLRKPLLHFHTQYNRDIPWDTIDMDFMNLNQSAHGDREHGFIGARLRLPRKVVVGYWQDPAALARIADWMRASVAVLESGRLKIARFGDNMREVAVTEGDKVEAQIQLGWSVSGYGVGELVRRVQAVPGAEVDRLMEEYAALYAFGEGVLSSDESRNAVREQARIEAGMKAFLEEGGFGGFTTTFEDLHGLPQLPGLAVQRLMAAGYGFGGEGDWKTAAMVRLLKIMAGNRGTSFMEDYTYHLEPGNEMVLGAHMLEVCPTLAADRPRIEVHPLSIGGKADPARLVFDGAAGPAVNASLVDMGDGFRLIVNEVEAVRPTIPMPRLPVARLLWKPLPSLAEAAEAWILAGGAHHTAFSFHVTTEQLQDWARHLDVECLVIDGNTDIRDFR